MTVFNPHVTEITKLCHQIARDNADVSVERRALAALLRQPSWIPQATADLLPEHFLESPARDAWCILQVAHGKMAMGGPVTEITPSALDMAVPIDWDPTRKALAWKVLEAAYHLKDVVNPQEFMAILESLRRAEERRAYLRAALKMVRDVADPSYRGEEVMSQVHADLLKLGTRSKNGISKLGDGQVNTANDGITIPAFPHLSDLLGGLKPKTLTAIMARGGVGKSIIASEIARSLAHAGTPVLIIDTELGRDVYLGRMAKAESALPPERLAPKVMGEPSTAAALEAARAVLQGLPLHYLEGPLESVIPAMAAFSAGFCKPAGKVGVVLVDYLRVLNDSRQATYEVIGWWVTNIREAAKAAGIAVVVTVQQNKQAIGLNSEEFREQAANTVGGSDKITQDADATVFLRAINDADRGLICDQFGSLPVSPGEDPKNSAPFNNLLLIDKNRHGRDHTNYIPLWHRYGSCSMAERAVQDGRQSDYARWLDGGGLATKKPKRVKSTRMPEIAPPGVAAHTSPQGVGA